MKQDTYKFLVFVTLFAALSLGGCGGSSSSLLPQASGEIPSYDGEGISIESDGTTNLVATGSANSDVPDSATVVFQVTTESASLSPRLQYLYDWVIPHAVATEDCAPEIPECPTLNDDSQCKALANADGSFSVTFPGSSASTVEFWWYDPADSCTEADHYLAELVAEELSVALGDPVAEYDSSANILYLFGTGSDASLSISYTHLAAGTDAYEFTTGTLDTEIRITGEPGQFALFADTSDNQRYFIHTTEGISIGTVDIGGPITSTVIQFVDSSDATLTDLDFLASDNEFVDTSIRCSYGYDPSTTYTRLFFRAPYDSSRGEAGLYITDDFDLDFSAGSITTRRASFASLTSLTNTFASSLIESTDTSFVITSVDYMAVSELGTLFVVLGYQLESTAEGETEYVLMSMDRSDCLSALYPADWYDIGSTAGELHYQFDDSTSSPRLLILLSDTFEFHAVDLLTMTAPTPASLNSDAIDPTVTFNSIESFTYSPDDGITTFVVNITTTEGEEAFRIYARDDDTNEVLSASDTDSLIPEILGDSDLFLDEDGGFQVVLDNSNGDDSTSSVKVFTPTF